MTQEKISRSSVGLRSERGPILLSVMLSTGLVAIDATILATAVPSIINDLGGFSQFPWLFSIYLLAQAAVTPICGKVSDLVGRRTVMLVGIGAFVAGSVLCGIAWSMPTLIAFRALQGLGAGAVAPMSMTIVGDLYSVAERAKVQGYLAGVWAVASVVGPTLGGVFSDFLNWRWIFFVNIPLGGFATWMLLRRFDEQVTKRAHRIDYLGAVLLATASVLVVLGLLEGGQAWAWDSWQSITILGGGLVLLVVLGFVERRAAEPVLPGWLFGRRLFNGANLASLTVGATLIGLTSYVPLFAQEVLSASAVVGGLVLGAMSIGWPVSSSNAGRLYLRIGFRNTALIGCLLAVLGTVLMATLTQHSSLWTTTGYCFVVGLGLGLVASPTLIAEQSAVGWQERGVVTGANAFGRSIGSALGIAVFGAIVNSAVGRAATGGHGGGTATGLPPAVLADALHLVFLAAVGAAVLMTVAVLVMPRRLSLTQSADRTAGDVGAAGNVGAAGDAGDAEGDAADARNEATRGDGP